MLTKRLRLRHRFKLSKSSRFQTHASKDSIFFLDEIPGRIKFDNLDWDFKLQYISN